MPNWKIKNLVPDNETREKLLSKYPKNKIKRIPFGKVSEPFYWGGKIKNKNKRPFDPRRWKQDDSWMRGGRVGAIRTSGIPEDY